MVSSSRSNFLKRGFLGQFISSYPRFFLEKRGIPKENSKSFVITEIFARIWRSMPLFLKNNYNPQFFLAELHDSFAAGVLEKSDAVVAWSSFGLKTIRKAKKLGMKTIIERGSSHILYQTEILNEEYGRFGLRARTAHPKIIEKELREYEEADYIGIPSLFVKRTFLEKGVDEKKLIHVPYGVDLSEFRQIPKKDSVFRVVFAGGMTIRKGVHYLLQAFSELDLPNSELLLIGSLSDEIKPFLKKYAGKFRYIGHVPQLELYEHYSQGSVFVIMSIEEGLAMVQPQAMACGLPVICTENTGGEDIVREGKDGFVIPIRDVEKLKEKLAYLYENPELCRTMGTSAKERVAKGFTWDDYGNKIVEEYRKIISVNSAKKS